MTERIGAPLEEQIGAHLRKQVSTPISRDQLHQELNGKPTPELIQGRIKVNVFEMPSVPSDVLVHPAAAALAARARRRESLLGESVPSTESQPKTLPTSADVFKPSVPAPRTGK